ncbi:hypothetical protein ACN20G_35250 (plasmid) [Streptomyces sp. BI20]|uniref:hypothetical protein n=1 Tax=Streptomyces sp. BI20 TaxID=3403460 RepID=UPI003C78B47E
MRWDKGALTALHLLTVWGLMTAAGPALGFTVFAAGWGGGTGGMAIALALGVPVVVLLLTLVARSARNLIPTCASTGGRVRWAVAVFLLGTCGVVGGIAAYSKGVDLGSAGTRFALTGLPYTVAAALFVPGWWARAGALAVLTAGLLYGGAFGPVSA